MRVRVLEVADGRADEVAVGAGVFPRDAWRRCARGGDRDVFSKFYVTNSIPTTTDRLPKNDVFEVIDLTDRLVGDLLRAPT